MYIIYYYNVFYPDFDRPLMLHVTCYNVTKSCLFLISVDSFLLIS